MSAVSRAAVAAGCAAVVWFGLLRAEPPAPEGSSRRAWTIDDVVKVRDVLDPQVSPDGRRVVFVVSGPDEDENAFDTDLYIAAAAPPGPRSRNAKQGAASPAFTAAAASVRLTRSPKPDHNPRWSPDGSLIGFLSGRAAGGDGDEGDRGERLWLIRPDGGEPWLPARINGSVSGFAWSPGGSTLALLVREPKSAERAGREKDKDDATVVDAEIRRDQIWLMDTAKGAAVQVTRGAIHFTDLDWSPDGKRLALAGQPSPRVPDNFKSDIYTLDVTPAIAPLRDAAGGAAAAPGTEQQAAGAAGTDAATPALAAPVPLVTTRGPDRSPRFSPDGASIVFLTQDGGDEWYANQYVATVPAAGGVPRVLSRAFDEEADNARFSADGRSVIFEGELRLAHGVFSVPSSGGEIRRLTPFDAIDRQVTWSRDGRVMALVHESPEQAPEVALLETPSRGAEPRPLTRVNGWTREHDTVSKEPFRWKAPDGKEIEGLLVGPPAPSSRAGTPLLVIVHGGPAGFFSNNFSVRRGVYPVQLFAQGGFTVLMPNPRGSGGYGETFRKANARGWGDGDYEDIMAGVDALIASGRADPERLGIMGWSYGGFMTARVITRTKRFKAASVGAGVTDTVSFIGVTDIPPFMRSYFGAWPWEDPAVYTSHTALFNVRGVSTPTLIQHGEADARVPISQGWELYVALKEQGVPVEFVTYPRQGHSPQEPKLVRDAMHRNLDWFARWVLGRTTP